MTIIFSIRLSELMKERGFNQVQLSKESGIPQGSISAWLSKAYEPSTTSLWILADFFDVEIDYLVGRKDLI